MEFARARVSANASTRSRAMSLLNSAPRDLSDVDAASRSPARASKWGSDAQPSPCPTRTIGAQNTSAREPHGAEEAKLEAEPVSRGDVADRDDPDESEEEKRNRRMASNRESARRSRGDNAAMLISGATFSSSS